jgi:hypothetical protein
MPRHLVRTLLGFALFATVPCSPSWAAEIPIEGQVLGVNGVGLPGVRVELRPALSQYEAGVRELAGGDEPAPAAQDVTSALGRYRVNAPRAGLWRLVVRADGYVPMELPIFSVLEERGLPAVRLRPDRGLRVRVVESYGKPIPGVRVLGQTEKAELWGAWWQPSGRLAVSGPDGGLRLSRAAGEPLRLWAAGPGFPAQGDVLVDKGDAVLLLQRGERRFLMVREPDDRAAPEALFRDSRTSLVLGRFDGKQPLALTAPATGLWDLRLDLADGRRVFSRIDEAHRPAKTTLIRVLAEPGVTLAGRIVDASSRRPIAGALVWASDDPGSAAWTDAAGTYRLSGRVPGSHRWLQAAAANYAFGSLSISPPVGSSAGFPRVADLPLVPAPVPAIEGVVVDEAGKPVSGAEVVLDDARAWETSQHLRRVSTSPAGSFRIGRLQAGGSYVLTASRSGFAPATLLATVPLPSQSQAAIRLTLKRGQTASGLVVDPRRRPISGAAVSLIPARGRRILEIGLRSGLGPFRAATGPDGRFRIPDLPAGFFELRIEGPELTPLPKKTISVPGGGGPADLGTFTLERRTRIAGCIVDPADRPIEGVEIWVVPEDRAEITQATRQAGPAAISGPNGRFELRDRAVGDHEKLRACRKGYLPQEFPVQGKASTEPRIALRPTLHLAGHVVDADGEPLADAQVSASAYGREPSDLIMPDPPCPFASSALTGADGSFTLELGGAGRYGLTASGAGHISTGLGPLQVPPEGLDGLEIRMDAGVTVSGHVADPEGHPIVGAWVRLSGSRSSVAAYSDDGGNFLLEGVETGEGSVEARHADFSDTGRKLQIRPEGTRIDLVLRPIPHLEVRGRVIGPDGAPIPGVLITDRHQSTSTLADGSFRLPMYTGVHKLVAKKEGFAPTETSGITVEDQSIDGVEIRLSYGLTLKGRVLGIDPAAVDKSSVLVLASSLGEIRAAIDSEGRFEIPDLPPGKWSLQAQAGDRFALDEITPPAGLTEVVHDLQFPPVSEVRGRVTGPGGEPIEGASLWFHYFDGNFGRNFRTRTLADGSFVVGVTDGTYDLSVSAEGYSSRDAERPIVVAGAPVEGVDIQLGPNVVLTGRLLGLEPGETIQFFQAAGPPSYRPGPWTVDENGHYRQTGLWPGDWTITARHTSGSAFSRSPARLATGRIHIPPGATEATLDLDFHMGDLTLTVRSAHPDKSFLATLLDADGSELIKNAFGQNGVSSQDGVVRFERLQAGTYRLRIEDQQGKKLQEQPVELTADREVVVDLATP